MTWTNPEPEPNPSPSHVHWYTPLGARMVRRVWTPPPYPHPLVCALCGLKAHPAACYDDGKLECCCGLDDQLEAQADAR